MISGFIAWLVACLHAPACAQVVINEVLENPPGYGDTERRWEFIELYGQPGLDLSGFILVVVKGGTDADRNGLPEVAPEIDEAFWLDGMRLDADGLFTLYNVDSTGRSELAERYFADVLADRYDGPLRAASFRSLAIPSEQPPDRLDHDGSSTYMLIHARPGMPEAGVTPEPDGFRKGALVDADFDGVLDHAAITATGPALLRPFQLVDEFAWSNRAGREYVESDEHEISETHGLNPDAIARVAYYPVNPRRGHYTKDRIDRSGRITGFDVRQTSIADESFVYGVLSTEAFPGRLVFFDGFDMDGWPQLRTPTDPDALPAVRNGRDPEPDNDPFPTPPVFAEDGSWRITDLRLPGFVLTPGEPNDHPGGRIRQQRFVRGDVTFDGSLDDDDLTIARSLVGATLFDRVSDGGNYRWQGTAFQQLLVLTGLSAAPDEDPSVVTDADVRALELLVARQPNGG